MSHSTSKGIQDPNFRDLLELVLLAATWGSTFLFLRIASPEFGPFPLVLLRTLAAGLFLMPFLFFSKQQTLLIKHWRPLFIVALTTTIFPFCLLAYTSLYTTSGYIAILNSTVPIFTVIIAFLWLKERLHFTGVIGILVGFIGVAFLVGDNASLDKSAGLLPVYAALCAAAFYGLGSLYTKQALTGVSPLVVATGSQFFAVILLTPAAIVFWPEQTPSNTAWFSVITLGILCTAIALVQFYRLLARIGPTRTVMVAYLIPGFSMLWGNLVLDEVITANMILGCSLTLIGVGFTTNLFRRKRY